MKTRSKTQRSTDLSVRPPAVARRSPLAVALALAVALGSYLVPGQSESALIEQFDPVNPTEEVSSGGYSFVDFDLVNNDPGAIYDNGTLSSGLLGDLANQLLALPANSHYGTIENLMGSWTISIRGPPTGDIYNGWNRTLNPDGSIDLSNIGGYAGDDYDQWISTPGANTMALTVRIPLSQLELDGQPGYDPATDARIELGASTVPNAFVANTGSPAEGLNYNVIPEPVTGLLLAMGCIALLGYRRVVSLC